MSFRERLRETFEERTGYAVEKTDRLQLLEQSDVERRALQRELDLLSYTALNVGPGKPQEIRPEVRRKLAERSRLVWMKDPQVGAAVDLTCDFVFGRGVNKPKANDEQVQEVLDETWDDPDNQLVLTSHGAQLALLVDLLLQSNLFFLVFEDGQDGKVKLGLLDHDTVETVVRDPDNRLRVLYYMARHYEQAWDFKNDRPIVIPPNGQAATQNPKLASAPTRSGSDPIFPGQGQVKYYEHWRNLEDATQDAENNARTMPNLCPPDKLGDGKVFQVSINRGSEMAFGHPVMDRVLRWASSYNVFLDARVDMMSAAAAFVMKRKVKGTPQQLQRMATQALSRRSMLGMSMEPGVSADVGPKAAGIITENDCFDDATELLTSEGWLGLDELKTRVGYRVAAMRDGALVFEKPSTLKLYEHAGEMVRIAGPRVDVCVTPNHRMLVLTERGLEERLAADVRPNDRLPLTTRGFVGRRVETFTLAQFVPRAAVPRQAAVVVERRGKINTLLAEGLGKAEVARRVGCHVGTVTNATLPRVERLVSERSSLPEVQLSMDRLLRWLGWWLSEGSAPHVGHVAVYQSVNSPYLESAQAACRSLGLPGTEEVILKRGFGASLKPLWVWRAHKPKRLREWLNEHCGVGSHHKRVPQFVFELAVSQQAILLKSLMEGDGAIKGAVAWDDAVRGSYHSASRGLADDVQRLALNCGMEAAVVPHESYWRVPIYKGGKRRVGDGIVRTVERVAYSGEVFCFAMPSDTLVARRNGRVVVTCNSVDHEPFALNTNAPQAQVDAQMLHGQISAATRWPLHYMGDQSQSNLATSTSLELPILKLVERFQELFETAFRFLFDRAIERAVDVGRISEQMDKPAKPGPQKQPAPENLEPSDVTQEAYEDEQADEDALRRDLGYEFSMPQPLKRMIGDIVTAAQLTAQAFDPNNSNTELSRTLLAIILGEGFELEDPAGAVERIFPQGYVDPATQAAAGPPGGGAGGSPFGEFGQPNQGFSNDMSTGSMGNDPQNSYGGGYGAGNPYGAVAASQAPEVSMQQAADELDARLEAELQEILGAGDQ